MGGIYNNLFIKINNMEEIKELYKKIKLDLKLYRKQFYKLTYDRYKYNNLIIEKIRNKKTESYPINSRTNDYNFLNHLDQKEKDKLVLKYWVYRLFYDIFEFERFNMWIFKYRVEFYIRYNTDTEYWNYYMMYIKYYFKKIYVKQYSIENNWGIIKEEYWKYIYWLLIELWFDKYFDIYWHEYDDLYYIDLILKKWTFNFMY